jgi:hypothetical protein
MRVRETIQDNFIQNMVPEPLNKNLWEGLGAFYLQVVEHLPSRCET